MQHIMLRDIISQECVFSHIGLANRSAVSEDFLWLAAKMSLFLLLHLCYRVQLHQMWKIVQCNDLII